jgi:phosphoenolpyruvate-protein phosphotransferase (PTS system enzyme I)
MGGAPVADGPEATLLGAAAAPGVGIGPAMVLRGAGIRASQRPIHKEQVDDELARLNGAVKQVLGDLSRTEQQLRAAPPSQHTSIAGALITSHRAVLTDPLLVDGVRRQIRDNLINASWAIECVVGELRNAMFELDNPGLRDWWRDVEALVGTLQMALGGASARRGFAEGVGVVAVAPSIGISDAVELINADAAGLVLEEGSLTSHVAVLCRAAGLPAVVGVPNACSRIENGRRLVVDGDRGTVIHDDEAGALPLTAQQAQARRTEDSTTACGVNITVRANLSLRLDAEHARGFGTSGVGLMRTFYQYVGRDDLPSEDELAAVYTEITTAFAPEPATIRLLDLGGSFGAEELPAELRNLRDCRGIRLLRERPAVVRSQIRALVRASVPGNLRLLVPFVTDASEVEDVRVIVDEAIADFQATGVKTGTLQLGAMVEVPAAVLQIEPLAQACDLLAIGTNDLAQYMLASSRNAPYRTTTTPHPAILRAITLVCEAGQRHGASVSLCGEVASEVGAVAALLQTGLRELSVSPRLAPAVIAAIGRCWLTGSA